MMNMFAAGFCLSSALWSYSFGTTQTVIINLVLFILRGLQAGVK